jgi:chromosome segregation ATPase
MNAQVREGELIPAEVQKSQAALATPAQAQAMLELAQDFTIDSPSMFQLAGGELQSITRKRKFVEEERLKITRPMDTAKKAVMAFFERPLSLLQQAENTLRERMVAYERAEQERVARERREAEERARKEREEAERAEREARERAEAERRERERAEREAQERAQAEARERERLAREAEEAARVAAAAGDAAAAAAAAEEADRARREAEEADVQARRDAEARERERQEAEAAAQREIDEARARADLADVAPALPVAAVPTAAGIGFRSTWKAQVVNKDELIEAAATRPELRVLLEVDTTALNQFARAMKGAVTVPGVRFFEERNTAVRTK